MTAEYVSASVVEQLHAAAMAAEGQISVLVRPQDLAAAVLRPLATGFGQDLYPGLATKAAALMHAIITRHPFLDGNKRAGLAAAITFLQLNGVAVRADKNELYALTMAVASGEMREVEAIAERLAELFGLDPDA